jgi:hypothetical protein
VARGGHLPPVPIRENLSFSDEAQFALMVGAAWDRIGERR